MSQSVCLARVVRSGKIESEHFGQWALCQADGRVIKSIGDPGIATYMRSSAKPFQAVTALQSGAGDRFRWTVEELAVVCASHYAEPAHLELVRSILRKASLAESDLLCGPHPPIDVASRDELIKRGASPERIHNNCSGKHAGMLAACQAKGWDRKSYLDKNHLLQKANVENVARLLGSEEPIHVGTDGCGVPTFYLTVAQIAHLYAQLATDAKGDAVHPMMARVSQAMRQHPRLVSGTGHLTEELVTGSNGRLVVKGGAEGVLGIGVPELGLGLAIKCADGSARALPAIACRILADLLPDLSWDAIRKKVNPPITNTRGDSVGTIEAAF